MTGHYLQRNSEGELKSPDGAPIAKVAEKMGTPCLVYWADRIRDNLQWLREAASPVGRPVTLAYALKAASHVEIARILEREGVWCEVMSEFEYRIARSAGFGPERIVVNGTGWHDSFVHLIVAEGVALVNIDNREDLKRLAREARSQGNRCAVGLRITPQFVGRSFSGVGTKLGLPVCGGLAPQVVQELAEEPALRWDAISMHCLHRETDPGIWRAAASATAQFAADQMTRLGTQIRWLDLGGGLDDRDMLDRANVSPACLGETLCESLLPLPKHVSVLLEPGRFIVGDAGIVLTKVIIRKETIDEQGFPKTWLIVDAGSNLLIPVPAAHFEVHALCDTSSPDALFSVADGICSPASVITERARLPIATSSGALLAVVFTGAYTLSMGENWAYPLPAVALIDRGQEHILLRHLEAERQFDTHSGIGNGR